MSRRSPRARFATPFVVVLGCGRPPAPPQEPREEPEESDEEVATSVPPVDAALPIDAYVPPDAEVMDQVTIEAHCTGKLQPQWNCNPPPPGRAKVIGVSVVGTETEVVFDRGTDDGIAMGWKGRLYDDKGKPVGGSDFVIRKAGTRTSYARIKLTPDQISANPKARMVAPAE